MIMRQETKNTLKAAFHTAGDGYRALSGKTTGVMTLSSALADSGRWLETGLISRGQFSELVCKELESKHKWPLEDNHLNRHIASALRTAVHNLISDVGTAATTYPTHKALYDLSAFLSSDDPADRVRIAQAELARSFLLEHASEFQRAVTVVMAQLRLPLQSAAQETIHAMLKPPETPAAAKAPAARAVPRRSGMAEG